MHITPATARTATLPEGKTDHVFWDDGLPGFGLRIRSSGSRSWLMQYDVAGKTRRLVIGPATELSVKKARRIAIDLKAKVRTGGDPAGEKRITREKARAAAAETFGGSLLDRYLKHQQATVSARWFVEIERHLRKQGMALHGRPVAAIELREISSVLDKIAETSGPVASNRCRGTIAAYFTWLASKGILTTNVAANAGQAATNGARDRVLTDAELVEVWNAAADGGDGVGAGQFNSIMRLLILLGLRRSEIADLRWSEIDLDAAVIRLPGARTKSGREHIVPIGPTAVQILEEQPRRKEKDGSDRDLVFGHAKGAGFKDPDGAINRVRARIAENRRTAGKGPMPHWTLHDFRRAISTGLNGMGVAPHIVEAVLGHHIKGVAGVYNHADYADEQRAALERWDAHIARLVAGKPAKKKVVVPFRRRA
jgi:integrase